MNELEREILLSVYENLVQNHDYKYTVRLNGFDGTILSEYRDAFRNLETQGFLILHFDNSSLVKNWEECLAYPCEITPAGIEAAVKEKPN